MSVLKYVENSLNIKINPQTRGRLRDPLVAALAAAIAMAAHDRNWFYITGAAVSGLIATTFLELRKTKSK